MVDEQNKKLQRYLSRKFSIQRDQQWIVEQVINAFINTYHNVMPIPTQSIYQHSVEWLT
jgi:hypothetical protein